MDFRGDGKDYLIAGVTEQEIYHATVALYAVHPKRNKLCCMVVILMKLTLNGHLGLALHHRSTAINIKLIPSPKLLHSINKQSSMYVNIGKYNA